MREIQHLPWRERERLNEEAWQAVRRQPHFWLIVVWLPLLGSLAMFLTGTLGLIFNPPPLICAAISLAFVVQMTTGLVWQRRRFREALKPAASSHLSRNDAMEKDRCV